MSTAGDAPGQYRGRRRAVLGTAASLAPTAFARHSRIAFLGVLVVALFVGVAVRSFAIGPTSQSARRPSPGGLAPVVLPDQPSLAVPGSGSTTATSRTPARSPENEPVPAIPPTASPVPEPSPATISYEAEAPETTRSPGVEIRPLPAASGGQYAANLGNGRTVRFSGVAAEGGGDYTLIVFYLTPMPRIALLRVNDGPPQEVAFPATGGWDQIGSITLKIQLLVGINTVEFGGATRAWAPDLDRITVH